MLVAVLLFTTQACAASYGYAGRYPDRGYAVDLQRRAYSNGYEEREYYRAAFRRGFVAGYDEAYRSNLRDGYRPWWR
jgi:hypothetical protein